MDQAVATAHDQYRAEITHLVRKRLGWNHPDVDDVVQKVFLQLLEKHGSIENVRNWLRGVAHHKSMDVHREGKRHPSSITGDDQLTLTQDLTPELPVALNAALASIPKDAQMVWDLCDRQGYTLEETATILGIPEGTVASRLKRARMLIRAALLAFSLLYSTREATAAPTVPRSTRPGWFMAGSLLAAGLLIPGVTVLWDTCGAQRQPNDMEAGQVASVAPPSDRTHARSANLASEQSPSSGFLRRNSGQIDKAKSARRSDPPTAHSHKELGLPLDLPTLHRFDRARCQQPDLEHRPPEMTFQPPALPELAAAPKSDAAGWLSFQLMIPTGVFASGEIGPRQGDKTTCERQLMSPDPFLWESRPFWRKWDGKLDGQWAPEGAYEFLVHVADDGGTAIRTISFQLTGSPPRYSGICVSPHVELSTTLTGTGVLSLKFAVANADSSTRHGAFLATTGAIVPTSATAFGYNFVRALHDDNGHILWDLGALRAEVGQGYYQLAVVAQSECGTTVRAVHIPAIWE